MIHSPANTAHKPPIFTLILVCLLACSALLGSVVKGFQFPLINLLLLMIFTAGLEIGCFIVRIFLKTKLQAIFWFFQYTILIVLGSIFCQMLLTLGASLAMPLVDEELIGIDAIFGFDWLAYFKWLTQHPMLMRLLDAAYDFMLPEIGLALLLLSWIGNYSRMQCFVNAYLIALVITAIIASLWPAMAGYVHYNIDPATYGISPPAARIHEAEVMALRNGELAHFPIVMKGIVTFPSFHAITALLILWALWPIKSCRVPNVAINLAMVISVMGSGGHYLADILGALIIVPIALYLACRINNRQMTR